MSHRYQCQRKNAPRKFRFLWILFYFLNFTSRDLSYKIFFLLCNKIFQSYENTSHANTFDCFYPIKISYITFMKIMRKLILSSNWFWLDQFALLYLLYVKMNMKKSNDWFEYHVRALIFTCVQYQYHLFPIFQTWDYWKTVTVPNILLHTVNVLKIRFF